MSPEAILYSSQRARPELLDPQHGEHVWAVVAVFRVSAETLRSGEHAHLDAESLAQTTVVCFVCEQPYEERLTYRKCPGEPDD